MNNYTSTTDVWLSGTDGYHTYRIPSVIAAPDSALLAFCEGRRDSKADSGKIDLLVKRSTDAGATWGSQSVLWADDENTCGNPCAVVDRETGVIWLLLTHNLGTDRESAILDSTGGASRSVWVTSSSDNGLSWAKPKEITQSTKAPDWTWYASGPGVGIQVRRGPRKGRLVIPCDHATLGARECRSHVIFSDDHGETWQLGGISRLHMNECQVAELADGVLMLNMRNHAGQHCRGVCLSRDGGESWGEFCLDETLVEPVCQASLVRSDSGPLLFSNPASKTKREALTLRISHDDGKTWPRSLLVHAGPGAYSCLVSLPDGSVGCLYECGESGPYEKISFTRVDL